LPTTTITNLLTPMARRGPAPAPSIDHYWDYFFSTAPGWLIGRVFAALEGADPSRAREILLPFAGLYTEAAEIPPDVWFQLAADAREGREDREEYTPELFSDSEGFSDSGSDDEFVCAGQRANRAPCRAHAGLGLELWSDAQLLRTRPIRADEMPNVAPFPNAFQILPYDQFAALEESQRCTVVDRLTVGAIRAFLEDFPKPDAVVLDPPIDVDDEKAVDTLTAIFELFVAKSNNENTFLFVWTDGGSMLTVRQAYVRANLGWCDMIATELVDELAVPMPCGIGGGDRSRSVIILRTLRELKRETFAQQRAVDCGVGIARRGGKSRGRLGLPQIPHEVAEALWPGDGSRVFLELWPTRMSPRKNWVMLDESC
jgi:hypothetical protein